MSKKNIMRRCYKRLGKFLCIGYCIVATQWGFGSCDGDCLNGKGSLAVSYTHLTLPTKRIV